MTSRLFVLPFSGIAIQSDHVHGEMIHSSGDMIHGSYGYGYDLRFHITTALA